MTFSMLPRVELLTPDSHCNNDKAGKNTFESRINFHLLDSGSTSVDSAICKRAGARARSQNNGRSSKKLDLMR